MFNYGSEIRFLSLTSINRLFCMRKTEIHVYKSLNHKGKLILVPLAIQCKGRKRVGSRLKYHLAPCVY